MKIKDKFVKTILKEVDFKNKNVLEVGCGDGFRTYQFAKGAKGIKITAVDPDSKSIYAARKQFSNKKINYLIAKAETLPFKKEQFDIVIFILSLHHINLQDKAFRETYRVLKNKGFLVIIEPGFYGTIFKAEIMFDCFDGDERKRKVKTYQSILQYSKMKELSEFYGKTEWLFDSLPDFKKSMIPKKNLKKLNKFLVENKYKLWGERRINIFSKI